MWKQRQRRKTRLAGKAREGLRPAAEQAREKAAPVFNEAMERLAPLVEEARSQTNERLRPAAEHAAATARDKLSVAVPAVTGAVAAATAASEPLREEAKRRGAATVAAMKGELEVPTKKSHKVRNLLVALGLGGAIAWAYQWFTGREADAAWQSTYEPSQDVTTDGTAAPVAADEDLEPTDDLAYTAEAPAGSETLDTPETLEAPVSDDTAAAAPDEALADAEEEPHEPTDPDHPRERHEI